MFDLNTVHKSSSENIKKRTVGFLLVNNFTMIALATAVEPLRMANQLSARDLYNWCTVSEDGGAVMASDGISITPDHSMADVPALDVLIVVGGVNITRSYSVRQVTWLQGLARRKILIGAVCTGPYLLAEAGLLDGYHCSAHWECIASMQEAYPKVICTNQLFVIERDRMTSSGGTVPMDMMLTMIHRDFGYQLTAAISEMFICDRVRNESDYQRIPLRHVLGTAQPGLVEAVSLMEANIEEAIDLDELAGYVGLSRRQLERLFQKYLHCSPSRYYMKLRLFRARQLLKQTSMSIIEIALACGFVSTPHFSKCYREHLGVPPREERRGVRSQGSGNTLTQMVVTEIPGLNSPHQESALSASIRMLSEARFEPTYGSVVLNQNI
ncbi:GlxA family transcriptional regulator [Mangrovibacter plantisponsor]|uniref:AraC family transcriptional regulator with amidase-like domain n=1 Tax=Mangrovibacter plantisponsor TaxID=451513 RepID=A0A317QA33_9ENTR|nr:GlxA family transcriptional regulator [Mangrovibacter plantisponsor]PWW12645.1 AraC family transcriptional regulator with amidase-like domain [Mangrovibacter plantisponsor]